MDGQTDGQTDTHTQRESERETDRHLHNTMKGKESETKYKDTEVQSREIHRGRE
jgi:hypothetical protein